MNEMALAIAIAFLSFSAPITAAIFTRKGSGNGFSTRELATMAANLKTLTGDMSEVKGELKKIWSVVGT